MTDVAEDDKPVWTGECWHRDDGLLLNLPIFDGCSDEFKRLLLRAVRVMEYEVAGCETWYDRDNDKICQLQTMPQDKLPPLRPKTIGEHFDEGEHIWLGGDLDTRLGVVLEGTVNKLVGDAPNGGRCVVRTLSRGDCEGLSEFLGVGSEQRTSALRAGSGGARVRFMPRDAVQNLLAQVLPLPEPGSDEEAGEGEDAGDEQQEEPIPEKRFPDEVEYFTELQLDRIDSLPHEASKAMLSWHPCGDEPFEYMKLPGQTMFLIDDSLGLKASGPLPEGIEERYFLDGQTVLQRGVVGDCMILILRGEVYAEVPLGCAGTCVPALGMLERLMEKMKSSPRVSWVGDGRREDEASFVRLPSKSTATLEKPAWLVEEEEARQARQGQETISISTMCKPEKMRTAKKRIQAAVEAKELQEQEEVTDYTWLWSDREALVAIDVFERNKLLSALGEKKAAEVRLFLDPPEEPPPPDPRALLGPGRLIGQLALLGVPTVLAGTVRAKGPVLITLLHRHILMEALEGQEERKLFEQLSMKMKETIAILETPPPTVSMGEGKRDPHLGPATGPAKGASNTGPEGPAAGTMSAFRSPESPYFERPGNNAMWLLLLNAIRSSTLLWDIIKEGPRRLLDQLVKLFEPRWLLPNEIVVADEEPNCDFLFVVIFGSFLVMLEGAEIDKISQGSIQGEAQVLGLNDWTRTIIVDPKHQGEAMVQILRRDRLQSVLSQHPGPYYTLRATEENLNAAKVVDWRILQKIPTFKNSNHVPFLARLFKDADILMYSPGDYIAVGGQPGSSLVIIIAGSCRCEHPETLFCIELKRGDWCYQDNYLGNEKLRDHDLMVTAPTMVLTLHRHTLLNAIGAHPAARTGVLENETWRGMGPQLSDLRVFEGVPPAVTSRLLEESMPRYFRQDSQVLRKGEFIADGGLLLILRGEVQVSILGIKTRVLGPGDTLGLLGYLDLPVCPSACEYISISAVDALAIPRGPMLDALEDDRYDEEVQLFKRNKNVFAGGQITDEYNFPIGGGGVFATDCVEKSELFQACSKPFVKQIGNLVEDIPFFAGEVLFSQGDDGDMMYFIQAGRVRLKTLGVKKEDFADAGAVLGDMAVLGQTSGHTCMAIAESAVWARALHKSLLDRALASFPGDARGLQGTANNNEPGLFD
eukprot:TRINITY_DN30521_c0_g1_i1.p1 TRINITY_DN30521_c0_g1~~TRINITY_DN30521_c0_g1_i1.p1  ORF type:complete len:1153 (-),score=195.98 TRINITY_DN30521_c0_g1_i1:570-4028(-)